MDWPSYAAIAFRAIHSLVVCSSSAVGHGKDAWTRLATLPHLRALFTTGGVREADYPAIEFAVTVHCNAEPSPSDPHYRLAALLKDADGLDRVRLGDLDPSKLRHDHVRSMVGFAKRMHGETETEL